MSVQLVDTRRVERHQRIHAVDAERLVDIGGRHAEGEHARHAGQLLQHADVRYGMVEEVPGSGLQVTVVVHALHGSQADECGHDRPARDVARDASGHDDSDSCYAGHHGEKPPVLKPIAGGRSYENAGVPGNPPHAGDRDHSRDGGGQGRRQRQGPADDPFEAERGQKRQRQSERYTEIVGEVNLIEYRHAPYPLNRRHAKELEQDDGRRHGTGEKQRAMAPRPRPGQGRG